MDLQTLSSPLQGPTPCGADMVFSIEFDRLADLRRRDDPTLDQGDWVIELKRADWPAVMQLCETLLTARSKDLRLAAWWAEAAAHVYGHAGLADGLALYTALCREQWASVHPQPEDGDFELRIGSIAWLLSQVRSLVRSLPVLQLGELHLSLSDIDSARLRPQATAQANQPAASDGRPPVLNMDTVVRAQRATPAARMVAQLQGARRLPEGLAELQTVIDDRLGADGPGFASVRDAVSDAVSSLERLARDMGVTLAGGVTTPAAHATGSVPADASAVASASTSAPVQGSGALVSRAQALEQLRQVVEFFRRTEPHSPVAYLADRAARWGEMPLHEWLRSVLKEPGSLAQIEELLGVPPAQPKDPTSDT